MINPERLPKEDPNPDPVLAAVIGLWNWQKNWVRFAATAEALKSELVKLQTRTGEAYGASLDEETVFNNFVFRIEGLASGELAAWGARQSQRGAPQDENG